MSLRLAALALLLVFLPCREVEARVSGQAGLSYASFEAEEGGERVAEGEHFLQKYSLFYDTSGDILHGRAGKWDLGLGLEWSSIDSTVNETSFDKDSFKPLFRGDLLLAPGGLPFRLHLYSQDMQSSSFIEGSSLGQHILDPGIFTDFLSGQHIRTGATLMVGIRNGSYLGRYRDVLSQVPRIFVDYSEDYVKNLEADAQQHYRLRNLAFVSLNKKDNWFHYRYLDYKDYLNSNEDYQEKRYLIGTVDHQLNRQWINMTNWIKVSVDGSLTTTIRKQEENPIHRYDINLFTQARRPSFNVANFTTFSRETQGDSQDRNLTLPFFANGHLSRDTSWALRVIGQRDSESRFFGGTEEFEADRDSLFLSGRVETFRRKKFILTSLAEAEVKRGDYGAGEGMRAGVEWFSNRAYRPDYDLFTSYSVAKFDGTAGDDRGVDYWEQEGVVRVERGFSSLTRTGVEERLVLGKGNWRSGALDQVVPRGTVGLSASLGGQRDNEGDLLKSTTMWFIEHQPLPRLQHRFEVIYDYLSSGDESTDQIIFRQDVRSSLYTLDLSMNNQLTIGNDQFSTGLGSGDFQAEDVTGADKSFLHSSRITYSPGRSWETLGELQYWWEKGDRGSVSQLRGRQAFTYNFFRETGIVRRLLQIGEELEYERAKDLETSARTLTTFTLLGNAYPTRNALLGARIRYRLADPEESEELAYFLTAGLSFEKLTVSLDYSYGTRTSDLSRERKEQRWEVRVNKVF